MVEFLRKKFFVQILTLYIIDIDIDFDLEYVELQIQT